MLFCYFKLIENSFATLSLIKLIFYFYWQWKQIVLINLYKAHAKYESLVGNIKNIPSYLTCNGCNFAMITKKKNYFTKCKV